MRAFRDLHRTTQQINKKLNLSFFTPPKSSIKLRRLARSEGKTNFLPNNLNTWYQTWPNKGHLTKRWQTDSTVSLQKTQEISHESSIILLGKRFCQSESYLEAAAKRKHLPWEELKTLTPCNKLHIIFWPLANHTSSHMNKIYKLISLKCSMNHCSRPKSLHLQRRSDSLNPGSALPKSKVPTLKDPSST
jgi:hypothetical protein